MNDVGPELGDPCFDLRTMGSGTDHPAGRGRSVGEIFVPLGYQFDGMAGTEQLDLLLDVSVLSSGDPVEAMSDQDPHARPL
jgi:hypothetical protein